MPGVGGIPKFYPPMTYLCVLTTPDISEMAQPLPTSPNPINTPFYKVLSIGSLSWALKGAQLLPHLITPTELLPLLRKLFPLLCSWLLIVLQISGQMLPPCIQSRHPLTPDSPLFQCPICFSQSPYNYLLLFYVLLAFCLVSPSGPWLHLLSE